MRNPNHRRQRILFGTAAIAAVIAGTSYYGQSVTASAAPSQEDGLSGKQRHQLQQQLFLKEHSDASGKPRPDLWRKGVEEQQQMKVAPYIGWHPAAKDTGKANSSHKK
jgi:hypothetical protein